MPVATSPRKQALMPSGPLRRALRAHGHAARALVQIGKDGVTDAVLAQLTAALFDHELVKLKIGTESPVGRFEVADRLAAQAGLSVVQILGRTILVYKQHPQHPRFDPEGRVRARAPEAKAPRREKRTRPPRGKARRGQARRGRARRGGAGT
jgi:RNA-binding protein